MKSKEDGLDLKIARIKAGLRQYELADRLGIHQVYLCQMEQGRRPIPPEIAKRIEGIINGSEVPPKEELDVEEGSP